MSAQAPDRQGAVSPDDPAWESLCRRCGVSCHFAVRVGALNVVLDTLRCRYLGRDEHGYHCREYERRFELAPWCHRADEAARLGLLAMDCLYRQAPDASRTGKTRIHPRLEPRAQQAAWATIVAEGAPEGACEQGLSELAAQVGAKVRCWQVHSPSGRQFPVLDPD